MYYRIGTIGRFLWITAFVGAWGVTTLYCVAQVVSWGTPLVQSVRNFTRSVGLTVTIADFLAMALTVVGFLIVPTLTAWLFMSVHRYLKGTPHAPPSEQRDPPQQR